MSNVPVQTIKPLGTPKSEPENGKVPEWLKGTEPPESSPINTPESEDVDKIFSLQPNPVEQTTTVGPDIVNDQESAPSTVSVETIATPPIQDGSKQLKEPKIPVGGENETIETLATADTTTTIADAKENKFLKEIKEKNSAHDGTN